VNLLGKKIEYDNAPKKKVKFIITSDVHDSNSISKIALKHID